MDLRRPLGCLGLSVALLMSGCSPDDKQQQTSLEERTAQFEKTLDTIQDPKLKDAVADLGGSLLLLERARLRLRDKPIETEYSDDALALLKHYPTPQALADTYINGLFVLRKASSSDYLTDLQPIFPFSFNYPTEFPFPHALEWQSVTLSNKQVVPFQPEWSETDPGIQLSPSSANMTNPDDLTVTYPYVDGVEVENRNQPQPLTLHGKVEVIAPRKVFTFDLTRKDIGKRQTNENISLTLVSLDKNNAEIELSNSAPQAAQVGDTPLNPLIAQAKDSTGQFLSRSGSINENAAQIAFYQQQLDEMLKQKSWSDAFEKKLDDEQKAFEARQSSHYTRVYFNGMVDKLEISVLDFSGATVNRKELDLPIRQFDDTTSKEIQPLPMPAVVYDDQATHYLKDADLDAEQLKKSVSISQSVDDASAARIEFDHPKTFNDELLGSSFSPGDSPVTFFAEDEQGKRGEPLELPKEAFEVNPLEGTITYDLNLFPETPAYAIGSIPLFLADIQKNTLDTRQLPKGLELKGNALVVDQKLFPAESWRFYARDDSGNYLKEILATRHNEKADSPPLYDVHYFYGQPTQLESYQRTNLQTVEYGFEVKLDKVQSNEPAE
ncbi:hypothetical protein [Pseudomonas gingeri]|uniref:Lipoprotein n=1 Tax=Pseudomonas gingeri TaxID=117681 RepID=A0A7Y7YCP8_9PSED|nr:hypothetical protein [Pseudomonas gingeri]NWA04420.1 hypothetical protein [Pseudomonas gingeri]NWA15603.1 hypothetical protein [Pseudomonas gingeri]NWA58225.1 hypothetical protein [Pseudomonas gingeri]NWA96099.1 hypothetical protein [Pseudomonas gingeri]NWB04898.1 hypothetical protein [Pseudomonas gingeri]